MVSLCLNTFNGSPYYGGHTDVPAWVDAAARAGFPLLGPDRWSIEAYLAGGGTLEALARLMRDAQVGCGFIGAAAVLGGGGDLTTDMQIALRAAQALGARFIQVNANAPDWPGQIAAMEEAAAVVKGSGVRIAVEFLPTMSLKGLNETVDLARHVGFENAGAQIDIWHHTRGPTTWSDLEAVELDAVTYLEFDDGPPMLGDDLLHELMERRVFPGEGEFETQRFADIFRGRGYDGMVSVEVLNGDWRKRDLREYAARAYETSAQYWL
jgi:sugar phosphate isomerase/epimerase